MLQANDEELASVTQTKLDSKLMYIPRHQPNTNTIELTWSKVVMRALIAMANSGLNTEACL